ncbi:hypothetical protein FACS1894190_05130 [Spirochaetia bacterium]|nr:hypothetical protein FACS1894190_05130 [Spirochaetia bacterium]
MANSILSFGLPVYNNAAMLDDALSYFYDELELDDFHLYVSDNGSTDSTAQVLQKHAAKHTNLHCFIQEKNRGTEWNAFFLQEKCETKYFMLLADYVRLYKKQIFNIVEMLQNNDYDFIVFNDSTRLNYGASKTYTDINKVLTDLGWYMTHMSAIIYSKEIFKTIVPQYIYQQGSEFYGLIRIFSYIAGKDTCNVYWYAEDCVYFSPKKKDSAWYGRVMYVWVEQYVETILSLPALYNLESKLRCLKSFYEGSVIFQFITFVYHIKRKEISAKNIYQYRRHLPFILKFDWRILLFISILPHPLVNVVFLITRLLRKLKYITARRTPRAL